MRGKVAIIEKSDKVFRITPAYAGKSFTVSHLDFSSRDHPRLCGEKCGETLTNTCILGITPAYAGKRFRPEKALNCVEDHPRLCGEKIRLESALCCSIGSPPPMRGKVPVVASVVLVVGITPAYAGKSDAGASLRRWLEDHPRLCGEKTVK